MIDLHFTLFVGLQLNDESRSLSRVECVNLGPLASSSHRAQVKARERKSESEPETETGSETAKQLVRTCDAASRQLNIKQQRGFRAAGCLADSPAARSDWLTR